MEGAWAHHTAPAQIDNWAQGKDNLPARTQQKHEIQPMLSNAGQWQPPPIQAYQPPPIDKIPTPAAFQPPPVAVGHLTKTGTFPDFELRVVPQDGKAQQGSLAAQPDANADSESSIADALSRRITALTTNQRRRTGIMEGELQPSKVG